MCGLKGGAWGVGGGSFTVFRELSFIKHQTLVITCDLGVHIIVKCYSSPPFFQLTQICWNGDTKNIQINNNALNPMPIASILNFKFINSINTYLRYIGISDTKWNFNYHDYKCWMYWHGILRVRNKLPCYAHKPWLITCTWLCLLPW